MVQEFTKQKTLRRFEPNSLARRAFRRALGLAFILVLAFGPSSAAPPSVSPMNVTTWGSSANGQLGHPTPIENLSPAPVMGLGPSSGTIAVAAGSSHSVALKSDGTVLVWGSNSNGQLGTGTTLSELAPVPVPSLGPGSGVVAIAAGNLHTLALKSDGTVLAWGFNFNGQLGDGSTTQRLTPVPVSGLSGIVFIAAGFSHSLAVRNDGAVFAWGFNGNGRLGDGTTTQRNTPVPARNLGAGSGVIAVAAGGSHSLALTMSGAVWAWGANSSGQLGDGTTTGKTSPVLITGISAVMAISAGNAHSLARKSDDTIWGWGSNSSGQLGDGTNIQKSTPTHVSHPSGTGFLTGDAISAGSIHSLAVQSNGTVLGWGSNSNGELGNGTTTRTNLPIQTGSLGSGSGVVKVAAGNTHSIALKSDGSVLAWGSNSDGQLGRGTFDGSPAGVPGLTDVTLIATGQGASHVLARRSNGAIVAWGFNLSGQLGDGSTSTKSSPVEVGGLGAGSGIVAIAVGNSHSLALKNDGSVFAWGSNSDGQLGDGTNTTRTMPVSVVGLGPGSNVIAIAAGGFHSLAVKSDGTVWAWGMNTNGQLGDGSTLAKNAPVQVGVGFSSGNGPVVLAAGNAHSLIVKSDGTVWAWGLNSSGQLGDGDGTAAQKTSPVQVLGAGDAVFLTDVVNVAAGSTHSLAVQADGTVLAWGSNSSGQLGDPSVTSRNTPGQVAGLGPGSGILNISAGASHSLAIKPDKTVWSWGSNSSSQLGDGTFVNRNTPVQSIVTGAAAVAAGNTFSVASTTATPTDSTPPMITANVIGTPGLNGWYISDVTVTWTINDPESNITSTRGCDTTTITTETRGMTLTCSATNAAGLEGSASITIRIDKNSPEVTFTRTSANANGWNNGSVLVRFTASDAMSGVEGVAAIDRNTITDGRNQSVFATFTDVAGNRVTATVDGINIDTAPPTLVFDTPNPAPNAAGWNNSDVGIGFTVRDDLSGVVSTSVASPLMLTTEGANVSGDVVVTDAAGNSTTVKSPAVKIDKTLPVAKASVSPAPNANGWNNTNVTVSFSGTDALSGIAACTNVVLTTDGANQTASGTCTDNAGNVSLPATASGINIDSMPPTLVFDAPNPAPNAAGWNNSDVRMGFTVRDNLSGVVSTSVASPLMLTTEGANVSGDVIVTDAAGNSATVKSPAVRIDKTLPVARASALPAPNARGWNNTNVTVSVNGTDTLSGIATCSNVVLTTNGANQSASGTCTDNAGNVSLPAMVSGINIDTIPPTLVFDAPNPAPNAARWNNSDVRIGFTANDNLSGVVSTSTPSPIVLTTEGANVSQNIVVTDAAGNSATIPSPAVRIDKTRPAARASASPAPDANGWNHTDVTVSFSGTDALSGIAGCAANVVLTTNGANQSASGTCTDSAGNASLPATASGINISKSGPVISGMPPANCTIWPPNKRFVQIADIRVTYGTLSIKVTSNEPIDASDVVVTGGVIQVRADRLGKGPGRIYTVIAKATDSTGNTSEATGSCIVPHDLTN
jgi:alpha-tubulin suppressor-like RCC1 family protein